MIGDRVICDAIPFDSLAVGTEAEAEVGAEEPAPQAHPDLDPAVRRIQPQTPFCWEISPLRFASVEMTMWRPPDPDLDPDPNRAVRRIPFTLIPLP